MTVFAIVPFACAQGAEIHREQTGYGTIIVEEVATGLNHPWAMAFLPDGSALITEREGELRLMKPDGSLSAGLSGVPEVYASGQGGLLDVALDPDFESNRQIYLSYAEPRSQGENATAVARAVLDASNKWLSNVEVIFQQQPSYSGNKHFGSRLVFAPDGNLFVTLGERSSLRDEAQNLSNHLGAVVRIAPDGSVPDDNPFVEQDGVMPEIWTYGHRNPQGAALNPESGELWLHEHGPRGGDEVNIAEAGKNYGWPVITHGQEYFGGEIGVGTEKEGMEQPIHYWVPSIAPSGMAFYTGDEVDEWQGDIFVGALAGRLLARLDRDGDRITGEERMLEDLGERIRDVRMGPDGMIYLLTDSPSGRVLRIRAGE
ncbi:PQQ-dependent sugar dehydrogenase [Thalassospira sp. A3_1]|uniref:PQQ-dependent sugar dehydrogenase n=1 Tax=Thalassospira sp. A3_1 TaxID=2821088 RepID=UPI001ADC6487|nr:PQQ-dependent sugar dehydrogenase [Thalassospira sp. A3_1]MBO9509873.1 PQQ-dependent sugar dehydrogenase [Thalassospira sp. A3_1]